MSIIYTETKSDKDSRTWIDLGDDRNLSITITGEGIIMDVYGPRREGHALNVHHDHFGTAGMMFDEWADWIVREDITL